uniref:Uncharacterized protein n=1 Tax=Rhizophora mucronata TaxID=61149 RepID=A0A2P2JVU3_RHIMU
MMVCWYNVSCLPLLTSKLIYVCAFLHLVIFHHLFSFCDISCYLSVIFLV